MADLNELFNLTHMDELTGSQRLSLSIRSQFPDALRKIANSGCSVISLTLSVQTANALADDIEFAAQFAPFGVGSYGNSKGIVTKFPDGSVQSSDNVDPSDIDWDSDPDNLDYGDPEDEE